MIRPSVWPFNHGTLIAAETAVASFRSPTWPPPTDDAKEILTEALRDLGRWLYRQLQAEYDHHSIEEGIIADAYTFIESGRRVG